MRNESDTELAGATMDDRRCFMRSEAARRGDRKVTGATGGERSGVHDKKAGKARSVGDLGAWNVVCKSCGAKLVRPQFGKKKTTRNFHGTVVCESCWSANRIEDSKVVRVIGSKGHRRFTRVVY